MKFLHQDSDTRTVQSYFAELQKYPPMSREEEEKTVHRIRKGDQKAVEHLITSNLRFVVSVALHYRGRGLPLSELIANGNLGLIEALKRFDETLGNKFITYAVWWIHQSIQKALKQNSLVSISANRQEDMGRILRHQNRMTQELGRTPTLEEVSKDIKISRERAERALKSAKPMLSLDTPLYEKPEQADRTLLDVIKGKGREADRLVLQRDQREFIQKSMASLTDRERRVVSEYFGLDEQRPRTLEDIGRELGITRERVRQIRNHAMDQMQDYFERRMSGLPGAFKDLM